MKLLLRSILLFFGLCLCLQLLVGCSNKRRDISFADLENLPKFTATVDRIRFIQTPDEHHGSKEACFIGIRMQTGEQLYIGDTMWSEAKETTAFGQTLQEGKSYEFPKVWLDFKAAHLHK